MTTAKRWGGTPQTIDELAMIVVPPPTGSYIPLPYKDADDMLREHAQVILGPSGFQFTEASYRSYRGGEVAIGELAYDFTMPGMQAMIQWVNSYNKQWRFKVTIALLVKVCGNGMHLPTATIVKARMHTTHILRDINPLVIEAIETAPNVYETGVQLAKKWNQQHVSDPQAHDIILKARRRNIITASMIEPVLQNWITPPHEEFEQGSRWTLYNAFTETMKRLPANDVIEAHRSLTGMFEASAG